MRFLKDIKKSLSNKIELQKEQLEQRRIENDLINSFEAYAKEIIQDLYRLNESPQLLNAVALGDVFREMVDKIAENDRLMNSGYNRFKNTVRKWDREIEKIIDDMKYRFEFDNPDKFRVEAQRPTHYARRILQALNSIIQEYDQILKEREEIKKEEEERRKKLSEERERDIRTSDDKDDYFREYQEFGEFAPFYINCENWINSLSGNKYNSDLFQRIKEFRDYIYNIEKERNKAEEIADNKSGTNMDDHEADEIKTQKNIIEKKLSRKHEEKIIKKYIVEVFNLMTDLEEKGHYNHITELGNRWMENLENLSNEIRDQKIEKKYTLEKETIGVLLSIIRENYRKIEDWMERANRKYENPENREENEPQINKNGINKIFEHYKVMRDAYIEHLENKRIVRYLKMQEIKRNISDLKEKVKEKTNEISDKLKEKSGEISKILKEKRKTTKEKTNFEKNNTDKTENKTTPVITENNDNNISPENTIQDENGKNKTQKEKKKDTQFSSFVKAVKGAKDNN